MKLETKKFIVILEIVLEESEKNEMPEEEYIRELINCLYKPEYFNNNESIRTMFRTISRTFRFG